MEGSPAHIVHIISVLCAKFVLNAITVVLTLLAFFLVGLLSSVFMLPLLLCSALVGVLDGHGWKAFRVAIDVDYNIKAVRNS